MTDQAGLAELVAEFQKASSAIAASDSRFDRRLDDFEANLNDVLKRMNRPGGSGEAFERGDDRASAIEMCQIRHCEKQLKIGADKEYAPSSDDIDQAMIARKAFSIALRSGEDRLDHLQRKSLSAFSFAGSGMLLPPERMSQALSCIVYPSSLANLFDQINISGPAAEFLIDNPRMGLGSWACEASCFANNPAPDLAEGLGTLVIKPETIRFVACATRDLIEDASMNFENWLMRKISDGMSATINNTLILGDGVGKPMGVLNPRSGIPICETAAATPAGSITWQDCMALKYEIPMQWHDGASYLMNQRTWAMLMMLSSADGRPLWGQLPGGEPGMTLCGSPVNIATQMPDIAPGSTPIAFGNWKRTYTIVWRKAVTLLVDAYSAGFCTLYKVEARVGGGVTCPNAARLLRIR